MNSDPGDAELHNTVGERCEREVETSDTLPSSASMSELSFIFSITPPVSTLSTLAYNHNSATTAST